MATASQTSTLSSFLEEFHTDILNEWISKQLTDSSRSRTLSDNSVRSSSAEFLALLKEAVQNANFSDIDSSEWESTKQMLADLSASRAAQGSTPTETANFILSLKHTLFSRLGQRSFPGAEEFASPIWSFWNFLDKLTLYTTEVYQKSREAIIRRQQNEMLEMSTPVIKLFEGILLVPLIGTLDSTRTLIVMENLLQKIVETGSQIAILDITGVPTVDTQTAQHLIKTVSATRLMGADCLISGIRPQIAQTIVHLGIDIYGITTKATMGDAVKEALKRIGWVLKPHSELECAQEVR